MTVVDDVKSRLDIVEVISQRVPLQRSGRSFKANCPFHQEKTPSFHVLPDRQSWRCFGSCATGGDVLSFVMRSENLEFGEALRQMAQQAGVTLPQRGQAMPFGQRRCSRYKRHCSSLPNCSINSIRFISCLVCVAIGGLLCLKRRNRISN